MMSTQIFAIRHGETDWNRAARIQGHTDIPLNAEGLAQAALVGAALAGESLAAIYSSDLQRARQTADAIAARNGALLFEDAALRERSFGRFEGHCWDEIAANWPEDSRRWRQREPGFAPGGGESLEVFYARCVGALERVARAHEGAAIAVVAHGGVLDCFYRAATRVDLQAPRAWALGNATINRLLWTGEGFTLIGWNDDHHLQAQNLDEAAAA
ncbi:MAG: histidine phosphatase family protein [Paucibacter sp.]|nr:histidine phosphatase family protein [Roseateles sp.]